MRFSELHGLFPRYYGLALITLLFALLALITWILWSKFPFASSVGRGVFAFFLVALAPVVGFHVTVLVRCIGFGASCF
jgi:hypothetical protein